MIYLTLFGGKTLFYKLWHLLDKRAKLDLRSTMNIEYLSWNVSTCACFGESNVCFMEAKV